MSAENLSQKKLFNEVPQLNNFTQIATVVASQIPLANIFNGQQQLVTTLDVLTNSGTKQTNIPFAEIQKRFDFRMYKLTRPKIIFATNISRQLPDASTSQQSNVYQPTVQFKIDYDPCCIGSMMLLLTVDISVRDTINDIKVYGYSVGGDRNAITIKRDDIKSIQYAYGTDFIYHYIKSISLGWASNGGTQPIMHQEVPIEFAKIYHTILLSPGETETIKRAVREDMFIVGHDPNRQYGDFSFALKNPANVPGSNVSMTGNRYNNMGFINSYPQSSGGFIEPSPEIAMYWTDTKIAEVGYGALTNNSGMAERRSVQATFRPPTDIGSWVQTDGTRKTIKKLNVDTDLYWVFGTPTTTLTFKASDQEYILASSTSGINIVSDLPTFLSTLDLSKIRTYPYAMNGTEIIALIPTINYDIETLKFQLTLLTYSTTADYSFSTTLKAGSTESVWNEDTFDIKVRDGDEEIITTIKKTGDISAAAASTKMYYVTSTITYDGSDSENAVVVNSTITYPTTLTGPTFAYENLNSGMTKYLFTMANNFGGVRKSLVYFA